MKSMERFKDAITVTMRGGGDSKPRDYHRRRVDQQEMTPSTSRVTPDARARGLEMAARVSSSQIQTASLQPAPQARG